MATEAELLKIIRQLHEKVAALSTENELLKRRLDIQKSVPQFSEAGLRR